jgi:light-regulated signal transduction histidine kinase (bacteriophytochrome)
MFDNVIGNAWKHNGRQPHPLIAIGVVATKQHERTVYVRDNGAGFDMSQADRLFAPFQRFHSMDEYPGSGIGLSIVARIVQRLDGRIWAESEVTKGSTFYIALDGSPPAGCQ